VPLTGSLRDGSQSVKKTLEFPCSKKVNFVGFAATELRVPENQMFFDTEEQEMPSFPKSDFRREFCVGVN